jgi:hypothetical protein
VLRSILARPIADPDVLWLIDRILDSGAGVLADQYDVVYFSGDDLMAACRPRGLPIGNLTSQFWANCLLNELDQFVKRASSAVHREMGGRCPHELRERAGPVPGWSAGLVPASAKYRTCPGPCGRLWPTPFG